MVRFIIWALCSILPLAALAGYASTRYPHDPAKAAVVLGAAVALTLAVAGFWTAALWVAVVVGAIAVLGHLALIGLGAALMRRHR